MTCQIILLVPLITEAVENLPESTTSFVKLHVCVCGSDIRCKVLGKYWPKDVGRNMDWRGGWVYCVGMEGELQMCGS